jgi:hypothetical protein
MPNALARRSSLLGDLRIILLGSWGFFRQLLRSWRRPQPLDSAHDDQHP